MIVNSILRFLNKYLKNNGKLGKSFMELWLHQFSYLENGEK